MTNQPHIPVLMKEAVSNLVWNPDGIYVDCTFGCGGYSSYLLENYPSARVIALDRDPAALLQSESVKERFGDRFRFIQTPFSEIDVVLKAEEIEKVDGIVADLGVSSPQLDEAERGFSFMRKGPLDMRMSQNGKTAADLVNSLPEKELADIIYAYGEERASRRIASAIVKARHQKKITETTELADIIHGVMPHPKRNEPDSAMRTFQALRICVNQELKELDTLLKKAPALLTENGRLSVVSFHSLEDRRVKTFFKQSSETYAPVSRYEPLGEKKTPLFRILTHKPILPSAEEIDTNSRAHSAKLRVAERRKDE